MERTLKILIVEDDLDLCSTLSSFLQKHDCTTQIAHSHQDMVQQLKAELPDLVILDIRLPDSKNGLDICKELREQYTFPIIMLSGSEDDIDKVVALERGANNFLTKPINPRVLLAFIESEFRQPKEKAPSAKVTSQQKLLCFGKFILNTTQCILSVDNGEDIPISRAEYKLLLTLATNPKRLLTRDRLLDIINEESQAFDRVIDSLISRVRKKIEDNAKKPKIIKTIRGAGYLFDAEVTEKSKEIT